MGIILSAAGPSEQGEDASPAPPATDNATLTDDQLVENVRRDFPACSKKEIEENGNGEIKENGNGGSDSTIKGSEKKTAKKAAQVVEAASAPAAGGAPSPPITPGEEPVAAGGKPPMLDLSPASGLFIGSSVIGSQAQNPVEFSPTAFRRRSIVGAASPTPQPLVSMMSRLTQDHVVEEDDEDQHATDDGGTDDDDEEATTSKQAGPLTANGRPEVGTAAPTMKKAGGAKRDKLLSVTPLPGQGEHHAPIG